MSYKTLSINNEFISQNELGPEKVVEKNLLKIRNVNKLIITFLIILSLLCGSILYYFKVYLSPQRITSMMVIKMTNLKTFDYKGTGDINIEGDFSKVSLLLPNKYNVTSSYMGSVDITDKTKLKLTADVSVISQNLFALNFDSRLIGDQLYLNIKNIPDFGLPNTDLFINQWVKINVNKVEKTVSGEKSQSSSIKKLVENENPFESLTLLKQDNIDDIGTFHLKFKIKKDVFFKISTEILESKGIHIDEGDRKTIDKIKDRISFNDGEMWIDKKDLYLRKIMLSAVLLGNLETNQKMDLKIELNLSNFNYPPGINPPVNSKPFDEILSRFGNSGTLLGY